MFKPTQQQLDVLEAIKTTRVLKVEAFSGTGKTSTLKLLAEDNVVPSIYLAFNSTIAAEAKEKFPKHVVCKTVHSEAFSVFGKALSQKLKRKPFLKGTKPINHCHTVSEIEHFFKIPDMINSNEDVLTGKTIASLVKQAVANFQYSADDELTTSHVYLHKDMVKGFDKNKVANTVLHYAILLWNERINIRSDVLCEHDTYLKLWQLSKPKLNYDIIYVDESQDLNPVIFQVLTQQTHCKIVYVGDTYQSIYAFRKAINAMASIDAPTTPLSTSFRFGQEIANIANFTTKSDIAITGDVNKKSVILDELPKKHTMIFRTNAFLIGTAVYLTMNGVKVRCEVNTYEFEKQLKSVEALYNGDLKNVKDEVVSLYSSWDNLLDNIEEHQELKRIVKIVQSGSTNTYLKALSQMKDTKSNYDVLLITAHKSKGMEWDYVSIADDFPLDKILADQDSKEYNQQEVNLFYVACTRTIKGIKLPEDFYEEYIYNTTETLEEE